ncbi:hypothetical protein J1614_005442 [Plenodomus biglobosus]|nr:hypothetical protein J1614_005442 [Plenodomus biglobosus]
MVLSAISTPFPPPSSDFGSDVVEKPFPFLRLPKDVRLMVYEQLPMTTNEHIIPMEVRTHHITIVNYSISGIHILATCRQINDEASYVLNPRLTRILKTPPEIAIAAKNLIGFIDFDEKFLRKHDIMDRILRAVGTEITVLSIHRYRELGDEAYTRMMFWLNIRGMLDRDDHASVEAIATFVLRAHKYAETYPSTFYK